MKKTYKSPIKIDLLNKSNKTECFVPFKENENFPLEPNGKISFYVEGFEKALYYENQLSNNIVASASSVANSEVAAGTYDLDHSTFITEASYNIVTRSTSSVLEDETLKETIIYDVYGTLPYSEETPSIGMVAGNRFTARFSCPLITEKSDLPGGTICTVDMEGGSHQTYNKNAFEDDGSMVNISNAKNSSILTITIKWSNELESTYKFYFSDIKLGAENETIENVSDLDISGNEVIITNNSNKSVAVRIYKENFNVVLDAEEELIFKAKTLEEILYYLLQANENLSVSL